MQRIKVIYARMGCRLPLTEPRARSEVEPGGLVTPVVCGGERGQHGADEALVAWKGRHGAQGPGEVEARQQGSKDDHDAARGGRWAGARVVETNRMMGQLGRHSVPGCTPRIRAPQLRGQCNVRRPAPDDDSGVDAGGVHLSVAGARVRWRVGDEACTRGIAAADAGVTGAREALCTAAVSLQG